ncbi:unnamed protein product, partial [Didymodactylos carnosus]
MAGGRGGRPLGALQSKGRRRRLGFLILIRRISTGTDRRYQSSAGYDVGFAKASSMLMVIEHKKEDAIEECENITEADLEMEKTTLEEETYNTQSEHVNDKENSPSQVRVTGIEPEQEQIDHDFDE